MSSKVIQRKTTSKIVGENEGENEILPIVREVSQSRWTRLSFYHAGN